MTNMKYMLFQNVYISTWNEVKKEYIKLLVITIIIVGGNFCDKNERFV